MTRNGVTTVAVLLNDGNWGTNPAISISDASAVVEGNIALKILDRFVPEGSGGLARPRGLVFGPDGNKDGAPDLYVISADTNAVLRYDGLTGSFLDVFVAPGSGGLNNPLDLAFGPDKNLYVTSLGTGQVLRYDGLSGAFLDVVVTGVGSPLGLTFGGDGSLYIAARDSDEILRYDGSGLSVFVSAGSGGLDEPWHAVFGPDGNGDGVEDLYVTSQPSRAVLRYDGLTGEFIDTFVTLDGHGPARSGWNSARTATST